MRRLLIAFILLGAAFGVHSQTIPATDRPTEAEEVAAATQRAAEQGTLETFHRRFISFANLIEDQRASSYAALADVYRDLDQIWNYSVTDPIGAFFNDQTLPGKYSELKAKHPGFAAFIRDYEVHDDAGATYVPTAETRQFLINTARDLFLQLESQPIRRERGARTASSAGPRAARAQAGRLSSGGPAARGPAAEPAAPQALQVPVRPRWPAEIPWRELSEWRRSTFLRSASIALILLTVVIILMARLLASERSPSTKLREMYRRRISASVRPQPLGSSAWAIVLGVSRPIYHRSVRSVAFHPLQMGLRILCALIPSIVLLTGAGAILRFHGDFVWTLLEWVGARPVMAGGRVGRVAFNIPTVASYAPGQDAYSGIVAVVSIVIGAALLLRPGHWTPVRVLSIFVAFVNAVSALFFFFAAERFPYTPEQFAATWVTFEFTLWILIPWIFAFFLAPLTHPLEGVLVTCMSIGYAIVFSAVRLAALLNLLYWGGLIWMATGYFVFGFLADFLYIVAFYSWAVSRASGVIAHRREAWTW